MTACGLEPVNGAALGILLGDETGEVDDDLGLLPRRVVLHLAVDHHGAGAVGHGFEDALGEGHFLLVGREDALGDVDLARVQRPGAEAALDEGVAELGFARCAVGEVAEGAVERLQAVGEAAHPTILPTV